MIIVECAQFLGWVLLIMFMIFLIMNVCMGISISMREYSMRKKYLIEQFKCIEKTCDEMCKKTMDKFEANIDNIISENTIDDDNNEED